MCLADTLAVLPNLTVLHLATTTHEPASYTAHGGCSGWTSRRCTRQPAPWPLTCWIRCCSSTLAAASLWRPPWPTPTWPPCMTSMPSLSAQVQPLASAANTHFIAFPPRLPACIFVSCPGPTWWGEERCQHLQDTFRSPYLAALQDQHAEPVCSGTAAGFCCRHQCHGTPSKGAHAEGLYTLEEVVLATRCCSM